MRRLEDCIPERQISSNKKVNEYVSCWTEKDILNGRIVDAMVVVLRTSGCSWARRKGCTMCGYFYESHPEADGNNLIVQMEKALEIVEEQRILKIYTSGSFLDEKEVNRETRLRLLKMAGEFFEQVIFETRPEFATRESMDLCTSVLDNIQVAVGLESSNDVVLKHSINKGFSFQDYLKAAEIIREAGATLRTYLLIKPPFLTEDESIRDAVNSAVEIREMTDVISFNPVNVQRRTLVEKLWKKDEYRPPWLWSVVRVLDECKDLGPRIASFPIAGGKKRGAHNCFKCDSEILKQIEDFSLGRIDSFTRPECECWQRWHDLLEIQGFTQSSVDIERFYG